MNARRQMTPGEADELYDLAVENGDDYLLAAMVEVKAALAARSNLIEVLELDEDMSWDDVVSYAAKAKSSLRMSNATVKRRSEQLLAVLDLPEGTTWPQALIEVNRRR